MGQLVEVGAQYLFFPFSFQPKGVAVFYVTHCRSLRCFPLSMAVLVGDGSNKYATSYPTMKPNSCGMMRYERWHDDIADGCGFLFYLAPQP